MNRMVIQHLLEECIPLNLGFIDKYITMDFIYHIKIDKTVTNNFASIIKLLLINKTLINQ